MNVYLLPIVSTLLLIVLGVLGAAFWQRRRQALQTGRLQNLLDLVDALERDLKTCRSNLAQAHAVMSVNPDSPAPSEQDARHAVDAGLRALLQQRLWIRDRSAQASAGEFAAAAASVRHIRAQLQPLLLALAQAQSALDQAMREHIRQDRKP